MRLSCERRIHRFHAANQHRRVELRNVYDLRPRGSLNLWRLRSAVFPAYVHASGGATRTVTRDIPAGIEFDVRADWALIFMRVGIHLFFCPGKRKEPIRNVL